MPCRKRRRRRRRCRRCQGEECEERNSSNILIQSFAVRFPGIFGFGSFLGNLLLGSSGPFKSFGCTSQFANLHSLLLAFGIGLITVVLACVTCCLMYIPYINTVLLLPVIIQLQGGDRWARAILRSGAVIGAFVMQSLSYGLSFLGVNSPGQNVVAGIVLILAVGISGIQQFGGSFWVEPMFNGVTLLIAIGIALCFGFGAMAVESYEKKVRL